MSNTAIQFDGGTIIGTPTLRTSSLHLGTAAPATFILLGSSGLSGDIANGQTIRIESNNSVGNASVTAATGFTNAGTWTVAAGKSFVVKGPTPTFQQAAGTLALAASY